MTSADQQAKERAARIEQLHRNAERDAADMERLRGDVMTTEIVHTMEEDFGHFLSYSGAWRELPNVIEAMRKAFEAAWKPVHTAHGPVDERYIGVAARIWCDHEYSGVTMNSELAERIARMLQIEAERQAAALASKGADDNPSTCMHCGHIHPVEGQKVLPCPICAGSCIGDVAKEKGA